MPAGTRWRCCWRLKEHVGEGVRTSDPGSGVEGMLAKRNGIKAAFKGYNGFPYCLCVSVNDEIVHGMPSEKRVLKEGDIVSLDFGAIYRKVIMATLR